ncbi:MAG TPA: hypothetical protein VMV57_00720 [Terracidiphilus sp.]|nr:hypothetical protein [Terracidiphilus sp.]
MTNTKSWAQDVLDDVTALTAHRDRLRAENAELRAVLADIGCALDVDDPYRAAEYCRTALGKPQDANPAPNPPKTPADERATGHESAGGGVS